MNNPGRIITILLASVAVGLCSCKQTEKTIISLRTSPDARVRAAAAKKLGQLEDPVIRRKVSRSLVDALADDNKNVRNAAANSLVRFQAAAAEPLFQSLTHHDWQVRETTTKVLVRIGKPAVGPLIKWLKTGNNNNKNTAAKALARIGTPAVNPLLEGLKHKQPGERFLAAKALGRLGDPRAVAPLMVALKDADDDVRVAAATALGRLGDQRAVPPLIKAMDSAGEGLGLAVVMALGQIRDPRVVDPLIVALEHKHERVCQMAVQILGQLKVKRAVAPLIAVLEKGPCEQEAAKLLGELGDPRAVAPLAALWWKRPSAALAVALARMGGPGIKHLLVALKGRNWQTRDPAKRVLGQVRDPGAAKQLIEALDKRTWSVIGCVLVRLQDQQAVKPLHELMKHRDNWPRILRDKCLGVEEWAAMKKLMGPAVIGPVIGALQKRDRRLRLFGDQYLVREVRRAVKVLERLKPPEAVTPLIRALKDPDPQIRGGASLALIQIGDPRAFTPLWTSLNDKGRSTDEFSAFARLISLALSDNKAEVRTAAAEVLGRPKDARAAAEVLVGALESGKVEVRKLAIRAMWHLRAPGTAKALIAALKDSRDGLQVQAVKALGQIAAASAPNMATRPTITPRIVKALVTALEDKDLRVRVQAAEALGQIAAAPALKKSKWHRKHPGVVKALVAALKAKDLRVRVQAARALGQIATAPTVEPLLAASRSKEPQVRMAAAWALGRVGDARAIDALIAMLHDTHIVVRAATASALGRHKAPQAAKPLLALLRDEANEVRQAAAKTLNSMSGRTIRSSVYQGRDPHAFKIAAEMYRSAPLRPGRLVDVALAQVTRSIRSGARLEAAKVITRISGLNEHRQLKQVQSAIKAWAGTYAEKIRVGASVASPKVLEAANQSYRRGVFDEAREGYIRLLMRAPRHLDSRNNLALTLLQQNQDLMAQTELEVLRRLAPDYLPAMINLTVVYERLGRRYRETARDMAFLAARRGKTVHGTFNKAWYHNSSGEHARTRELLKPLVKQRLNQKFTNLYHLNERQARSRARLSEEQAK